MSSTPTLTREEFLANLSPVPVARSATIDKDTTCIICIADPVDVLVGADDERAVVLHDRHVFGERCIREWLSENNTCPKCRAVLFEADEDDWELDQESDFDSDYDMDAEMEDEEDEDEDEDDDDDEEEEENTTLHDTTRAVQFGLSTAQTGGTTLSLFHLHIWHAGELPNGVFLFF